MIDMKKSRILKLFAHVLVLAVMVSGICLLSTGCTGVDDKQALHETLTAEFDLFKSPTKENLEEIIGGQLPDNLSELEEQGLDPYELMSHLLRGFDYEIGDTNVDGDKASVDMTFTILDYSNAVSEAANRVTADEISVSTIQEYLESGDNKGYMRYIFSIVYDVVDEINETTSFDATVTLTKTNGKWSVDEGCVQEVVKKVEEKLQSNQRI